MRTLMIIILCASFAAGCMKIGRPIADEFSIEILTERDGCPVVVERVNLDLGDWEFYVELVYNICSTSIWICSEGGRWAWQCDHVPIDPEEVSAIRDLVVGAMLCQE